MLDHAEKGTHRTRIPICKVLWSNHIEEEATREQESELCEKYSYLFETEQVLNLEGEILLRVGGDCNIPYLYGMLR